MKKIIPYIGVALIVMGTLTLAATRLSALSGNNWMLLTGLAFIVLGIVLHIRVLKRQNG